MSLRVTNLFISYRRDDSSAWAGRLCDHLTNVLGPDRVFMDVEDIQPGRNFAEAIETTLKSCSHVLVVIGPRWHDILLARAQSSKEDYVVHEVATALKGDKTVVPVFVGGAASSALTALPPALSNLPFHQAVELRDSSFNEDCDRLTKQLQLAHRSFRKPLFAFVAAVVVLALGLAYAAYAGLGPWRAAHQRKLEIASLLNTAQTQLHEVEYESAFNSYQQVLALDPLNSDALHGQVDAAMIWIERFHVLAPEGQKAEDVAAPQLAKLDAVLEAGLARTNGKDKRAADILAHLGWLHYMNEKIAFKEFGNAERYFEQALAIDPSNVYAHAFMGNWLLQTNGDSALAIKHFQSALAANSHRDLVRSLQLGALLNDNSPGMRAEFVKALNQVRINKEPLDEAIRERTSYLYSPTVADEAELRKVLTAVPPDQAWNTFLWLNPEQASRGNPPVLRDFIHASLAELSGDRSNALVEFKALSKALKSHQIDGRIADFTDAAIRRLSN